MARSWWLRVPWPLVVSVTCVVCSGKPQEASKRKGPGSARPCAARSRSSKETFWKLSKPRRPRHTHGGHGAVEVARRQKVRFVAALARLALFTSGCAGHVGSSNSRVKRLEGPQWFTKPSSNKAFRSA